MLAAGSHSGVNPNPCPLVLPHSETGLRLGADSRAQSFPRVWLNSTLSSVAEMREPQHARPNHWNRTESNDLTLPSPDSAFQSFQKCLPVITGVAPPRTRSSPRKVAGTPDMPPRHRAVTAALLTSQQDDQIQAYLTRDGAPGRATPNSDAETLAKWSRRRFG